MFFAIALGLSPVETVTVLVSGSVFLIAFTWVSIKGDLRQIARELIEESKDRK
tara:strand:- start:8778 stop:8936 length:159 start_codon:yes stop_codon:yes gene_type:complete